MRTSVRSIVASAAAILLCLTPDVARAENTSPPDRCESVSIPVPLGAMAGTLCVPAAHPTDTVMVLIAGSNYNHTYWDFHYAPETYNFRRAMNAAGYATLVVDRLGNGASTRPPSTQVTASVSARALHDIVQSLRRGLAGAPPFGKVVTGGHSLSSGIDVLEASTYQDVDGVLLTGFSHALNVSEVLGVIATYHQAAQDPHFAGRGYDPGYLATQPGTRARSFFAPETADPEVLAVDEATKEVFSPTEYPDGLTSTLPPMSNFISVPVLVVNGSLDRLSCGPGYAVCANAETLHAAEAPFFGPAARLRTFVLPGSGHSVNLARNTAEYRSAVIDWMESVVE
ncbi:alpha/beta hydrolase [Nocardia sp. NBC_00508]|uniref:alpha/beta hydrolase n=1 Tax=Nocardia sp. NBC_00508 TaxID=2975992 RepID=UPI002E803C2B|nr:alpha/beta hydrolase [Nocardia sp. NBC_00508]WUD65644.1 alpha/beta hydrolase [Nocardia sp. NBC_00508]